MPYFIRPFFISESERVRLAALDKEIIRRAVRLAFASKNKNDKDCGDSPDEQDNSER